MNTLTKAILSTLAYADIFDYPLTSQELFKFLISPSKRHSGKERSDDSRIRFWTSQNDEKMLKQVQHDGLVGKKNNFYFLVGREGIVKLRKQRGRWSRKKSEIAQKAAGWLRFIPWIKMVGITGGLAILNTDKDDDIDILIVSSGNRLWLTRLWSTIVVSLVAGRRRPFDTRFRDKICLNMFLDEDHLTVPKKEQDLFTAHEVVQMRPLWDKDNAYKKFLAVNQWVRKFLPNGIDKRIRGYEDKKKKRNFISPYLDVFCLLELLAKKFQLWYMNKRRTTEVITEGIIRFHPQDARNWVLKKYQHRLFKLGLGVFLS